MPHIIRQFLWEEIESPFHSNEEISDEEFLRLMAQTHNTLEELKDITDEELLSLTVQTHNTLEELKELRKVSLDDLNKPMTI